MRAVPTCLAVLLATGCDGQSKLCHERMTSAQAIVARVDGKSAASVRESLQAVEGAHATCQQANLGEEQQQLLKARNELQAQLDLLEARARRKKASPPTLEELAQLARSGDPSCPQGQAYKPKNGPREIRCTGPQLVEMSAADVQDYYGGRRYKVTSTAQAPFEVRAELGSELFVFDYEALGDGAPRCVTAYAAPGLSWQEVVSRLTGAAPERLKLGGPVKIGTRELALEVQHAADTPKIRLGSCANTP